MSQSPHFCYMGWFLLPYFVFHLLLHFPAYTYSLCNSHDKFALLQFKNSFSLNASSHNNWWLPCSSVHSKTESWKYSKDCCQWDGVTCDTKSGHVIGLDLSCSNLEGEFHPNSTIYQLRHLQQLNLAFNRFSGPSIYSGIGDLVNLTHLNLSQSSITVGGDIPSTISHLSKLVSLDLSQQLEMRLDPSTWNKLILNATNLREIVLDDMDMSSITESSLSLLRDLSSSLVSLSLANTQLQGKLPDDILCFPNLHELRLNYNPNLRGELPKSNWNTSLRYLYLSFTAFSGEIPDSIGYLKSLNHLSLKGCNFDGLIPSSLFDLTQLSHLELYDNKLAGSIPSKTAKLSNLNHVDLSSNMLNGTIPHWCYSLPSLSYLDLSDNHLTGSIGKFSTYSLKYLYLSLNNLEGNFPYSIFEIENLNELRLSSTQLSGRLDFYQFSKLKILKLLDLSHKSFLSINIDNSVDNTVTSLERLFLSSCNISSFPKFLAKLQNLKTLDLSDNKLNINNSVDHLPPNLQTLVLVSCNIDSFPKFLARLENLQVFALSNNKIHGEVPKWFHEKLLNSWKNMCYLDLSFNKLQGHIPIPPYGTTFFSVSNNNFSADIPSTICNACSLSRLNLAHNNLTGTIPQCLGTFPYLWELDLQMNNLHGSMPNNFSKGSMIDSIKLNGNKLEGLLPQSLDHCSKLEVLDLADNNIEDTFPSWLETLQELQVLNLRSNKLHGAITCFRYKFPFPKMRIFDVSNNNFSGPLPASCFKNFKGMMNVSSKGQTGLQYMRHNDYNASVVVIMKGQYWELVRILTTFTTIDLSNNMFVGEIPQVIGELKSLKGLNLSHNGITGTIPQSLSNLRNLESLDLSWNQLRVEIPMALTNLNFLAFLNLSQNQFEGIIPTGKQFDTFGNDSYKGNPKLCGLPLSKPCNKDGIGEQPPNSATTDHEESGFGWKAVAVGYACGMVFGMLLGFNVFFTGKPQWLARQVESMFNIRVRRTIDRTRANRRGRN